MGHKALSFRMILTTGMLLAATAYGETRVDFELVTEPGFPLGGERQWLALVGELPQAHVRIRTGRGRERPEAEKIGADRFRVTGILTSRNKLVVPGGEFGLGDRQRLQTWMAKLGNEGTEGIDAARDQFGLTEPQLVALHDALTQPLRFTTKGLPVTELLQRCERQIGVPWVYSAAGRAKLRPEDAVFDELEGLSAGTAVALALRPFALAMVPRRAGGRTELEVRPASDEQAWPAGWPAQQPPKDAVPDLFKFLNVEIHETPVAETLSAIQGRVDVRFLYDHNALAQHGIDLAQVKASVPAGRTYYKRILDRVLFKATLHIEIRTDEAGTPFLWITR